MSFVPTAVAGPSGVGKGTVIGRLRELHPEVWFSISATTREPRPGEVDGRDYFFVSETQFDELIAEDGLLEWATVHHDSRYGTPRRPVERKIAEGRAVVMDIDVQGCAQAVSRLPALRTVFLAPPSWDELVRRLRSRATESAEEVERRLETARLELAQQDRFDVVLVNDQVARVVDELVRLIGLDQIRTAKHDRREED